MLDGSQEAERRETIEELSALLSIAQEMGKRLADETHGDLYASVNTLNELLHQARVQMAEIQKDAAANGG